MNTITAPMQTLTGQTAGAVAEQVIHLVRAADVSEAGRMLQEASAGDEQTITEKMEAAIAVMLDLIANGHALGSAFSGGKDSSTATILMLEAVRRATVSGLRQARHYITSASTGVENPAMESHLLDVHAEMEAFIAKHDLPVEVKLVKPSLAAGFVVTTIGRGTLPRFPENGADRQCSVDWKVAPQQRLAKALSNEVQANGYKEMIAIIGTRFEESTSRATRMADRGESEHTASRDAAGRLSLSPIAQWALQDVWDMLALFMEPEAAPFETFTDGASIFRLFDLYREANEGTCGIVLGDGGTKAPCGPRFGCSVCTITGAVDKSMESMLREPKHAYMAGLNDFRNLLVKTQHDYSKRELVGRTLSDVGYLPVRPDVYSLEFRKQLLRYLITLDVLEEERAEQTEADIITGKLENTPENRRMTTPQFEMVTISQLVAVDFFWGMHHYAQDAFPAIEIWHDIRHLGRRYKVPTVDLTKKTPVPAKRWFQAGAFDHAAPTDGLRDYAAEQWNRYLHPERPMKARSVDGKPMVWFEETDSLEVDAEAAYEFVEMTYPEQFISYRQHGAIEGARFLLNEELLTLPAGMAARYQTMAERGQYFAHLASRLNLSPREMDAHLMAHSITDSEHESLLAAQASAVVPDQSDLFAEA